MPVLQRVVLWPPLQQLTIQQTSLPKPQLVLFQVSIHSLCWGWFWSLGLRLRSAILPHTRQSMLAQAPWKGGHSRVHRPLLHCSNSSWFERSHRPCSLGTICTPLFACNCRNSLYISPSQVNPMAHERHTIWPFTIWPTASSTNWLGYLKRALFKQTGADKGGRAKPTIWLNKTMEDFHSCVVRPWQLANL